MGLVNRDEQCFFGNGTCDQKSSTNRTSQKGSIRNTNNRTQDAREKLQAALNLLQSVQVLQDSDKNDLERLLEEAIVAPG